jgi:homoserine kinase type II
MSVYTKVSPEQLAAWLRQYSIGELLEMQGIAAGIENTNYFVTTSQGRYVLTLFERMNFEALPFYLNLMAHLAQRGIPCPAPIANRDNALLGRLNGKPAALVTRLSGAPVMNPADPHCGQVGAMLAAMHLAAVSFQGRLDNPRGLAWQQKTAPEILPFLDARRCDLLKSELDFQAAQRFEALPRGPVHADLFRDNVLFEGEGAMQRIGGVIDFYFAGIDSFAFDVAVAVNDWCVDAGGNIDPRRAGSLLAAYQGTRAFTAAESAAWPAVLRAAALRFWMSRLYDFYLPRPGELTHAHDPEHFRRVLDLRRAGPWFPPSGALASDPLP